MSMGSHWDSKQITVGDLIMAVTEAAFEVTGDEDQAYQIASLVLVDLLQSSAPGTAEHWLAACAEIPIQ